MLNDFNGSEYANVTRPYGGIYGRTFLLSKDTVVILFERKYTLPVVFHADHGPAILLRLIV